MENSDSHRRSERFDLTMAVTLTLVRDGRRATVRAEGHDVSKGGLRLSLRQILQIGESLALEFVLPYTSTAIVIRGVVRHQSGLSYGVEFINPTAYQTEMLERNSKVLGLLR